MTSLIYILIGLVLGILSGYFWGMRNRTAEKSTPFFNIKRSKRKGERKQKILDFIEEKGRITNNDVEELVGVSDATATNYLEELEREGEIVQQGKTGRSVFYTKK